MDNEQLSLQLKGLQQLPDMLAATVIERIDTHLLERMQVGQTSGLRIKAALPLSYEGYVVGELEVSLTLRPHLPTFMAKSLII